MNCPYCNQPLLPSGEKCPSCGMDAEGVRRWLGAAPSLRPGFNDLTGELADKAGKCFLKAVKRLRDRHAQCDFHWIHERGAPGIPPRVRAFHFFNHGRLCSPSRSGGNNRGALLLTDPENLCAALVVGYGIEPFLQPGEIEQTLASGYPALRERHFGRAAETIVGAWERQIDRVLERLPRAFGLPSPCEIPVRLDESVRVAAMRQPSEY